MTTSFRTLLFQALFVGLAAQGSTSSGRQSTQPGREDFVPTKVEWAALELQAVNGQNTATGDSPLIITFLPWKDGRTIKCLLQFTDDYAAGALATTKASLSKVFQMYVEGRGWTWLRLDSEERSLGRSWPGR